MPTALDIIFQRPASITQAIVELAKRDLLPTGASAADIRQWSRDVRNASLFSARTTHLGYLKKIQEVSNKMLSGEINIATGRALLQDELDAIGYTPESGFPSREVGEGGEGREGIPPAERGSLRDLSSDPRLKLILETQTARASNFALREQGMDDLARFQFPAWELIRIATRDQERDWQERFVRAGGTLYGDRMVALKDDDVWTGLGDSGVFDDGLDTDTPPYAFNSGMGWREVSREECIELGLIEGNELPEKVGGRLFDVDDANRGLYSDEEFDLITRGLRDAAERAAA